MEKLLKLSLVSKHVKEVPSNYGYSVSDLNRICVYSHVYDNEDKPFYIGQGRLSRAFNFLNRDKAWKNKVKDVRKVKVDIIKIDISIEESIKIEKQLIKQYGRIDNNTGCLVNGNDGDTAIGQKGENNYFYNKHLYKEENGNYGNKYDKNPLSIPIIQIDIFGNIVKRWASATEAEEIGGFSSGCISGCCLGKRHIHKGYQWIFEKDYNSSKDYELKPHKTLKAIIIKTDIYGNYVKTYYNNEELINDGYIPKNVQQVTSGHKKSHRGYKFVNFIKLSKEDKLKYIDKVDISLYN